MEENKNKKKEGKVYIMNIYDFSKKEILERTQNLSKFELKEALDNPDKVTIYSINDYINDIKNNGLLENVLEYWDVNSESEFIELFKTGVSSGEWIDTGIYQGCDYVLEWCI